MAIVVSFKISESSIPKNISNNERQLQTCQVVMEMLLIIVDGEHKDYGWICRRFGLYSPLRPHRGETF